MAKGGVHLLPGPVLICKHCGQPLKIREVVLVEMATQEWQHFEGCPEPRKEKGES